MPFLKLLPLTMMAAAFCVVALLATACAAEPAAPPNDFITLQPPPTATMTPEPTPAATAAPALPPTPTVAPTVTVAPAPRPTPTVAPTTAITSALSPNLNSDTAVPEPEPEPELCPEHGYCDRLELGGRLLAAAWLDDDRMYLADWEGRIRLLNVKTGDVTIALEGLSIPRGLTVMDGRLYVSEMGNVCQLIETLEEGQGTWCKRWPSGQRTEFFSQASAQILSYKIDDSGGLSERQVVVDRIIAWERDHAPNGLANDGEYVYVSIGHPMHIANPESYFITHVEVLEAHQRRTDLMGTVARFRPPYDEVEVYATGFRNVYGISIAPDGTIYGADNDQSDGLSKEGHLEELNAIVKGGFYGWPRWGTGEAPPEANVVEPVAVLQGAGSSFAHANADGVYVGYLALDDSGDGFVVDRFDYDTFTPERIFSAASYTTAILERNELLYLIQYDGNVHVINPDAAPVSINAKSTSPYHTDDYVEQVTAGRSPIIIHPGYEVYVDDGRLIYDKDPCQPAHTEMRFFLHIVPVNRDDLPEDRKQYNFDNLDFSFANYGWRDGGRCRAVRRLPEYDISVIRTGQSIREETGWRRSWEAEYRFER